MRLKNVLLLVLLFFLVSCISSPENTDNQEINEDSIELVDEQGNLVGEASRITSKKYQAINIPEFKKVLPSKVPFKNFTISYLQAIDFETITSITQIDENYNKQLSFSGNLAPFPTKSLQTQGVLKTHGIINGKKVNLEQFYLLSGPQTEMTPLVKNNADFISEGPKDVDTVKNIMKKLHQIKKEQCTEEKKVALGYDFEKNSYPTSLLRSRTAHEIIVNGCLSGCTDFAHAFVVLARAKNIPAAITETVSEQWIAEMVKYNQWNGAKKGHFFVEVYLEDENRWIVIDPAANKLTGRDNKGYYPSGASGKERFMLFERGLDSWDYGIETDQEFGDIVKKRYYIEGSQP